MARKTFEGLHPDDIPKVWRSVPPPRTKFDGLEEALLRFEEATQSGSRRFEINLDRSRRPREHRDSVVMNSGSTMNAALSDVEAERGIDLSDPNQHAGLLDRIDISDPNQHAELIESLVDSAPEDTQRNLQRVHFLPVSDVLSLVRDPNLVREYSPRKFEELTAELLSGLGYQEIRLTSQSGDGGIDVFATKEIDGIPIILGCECKRYSESNKVGVETVRTLLGSVTQSIIQATMGVLVTTSTFTKGAQKLIGTEARLDGKDFFGVVDWIKKYSTTA